MAVRGSSRDSHAFRLHAGRTIGIMYRRILEGVGFASVRWAQIPEVSRFFGIMIRMYFDEHNPPHFHAVYAGNEAQAGLIL